MKSEGIICDSIVKPKDKHRGLFTEVIIYNKGQSFLVDSVGNKFLDFKNIRIKQNGNYVILEDTVLNNTPLNILLLASINRCEEINKQEQFALVYSLNKYFRVNKYAEMSFGFDMNDIYFNAPNKYIYCIRDAEQKFAGL